jgi:hypothetical protein
MFQFQELCYGNLQAGNFLKYWKKSKPPSYHGRREKAQWLNKFSLLFASLWQTKLINPRSARFYFMIKVRLGIILQFLK